MVNGLELPDVFRRISPFATAGYVGPEIVELFFPVANEGLGDAGHGGHFADGVITFGQVVRYFAHGRGGWCMAKRIAIILHLQEKCLTLWAKLQTKAHLPSLI